MIKNHPFAAFLSVIILISSSLSLTALDNPQNQKSPSTTIPVDSLADDLDNNGNCTLREAIQAADQDSPVDACPAGAAGQPDTITFSVDGAIHLSLGELQTDKDLIIKGNGPEITIIDADQQSRIFNFSGGKQFNLSSLTLQHGFTNDFDADDGGGAIYNAGSTLTLDDVNILESIAFGPYALGAAIYSEGPLVITSSLIKGNLSELGGGAIVARTTTVEIDNSIIRKNFIDLAGSGGGLLVTGSDVIISNSRIEDNSAGSSKSGGGGVAIFNEGHEKEVRIINSILSGNSSNSSGDGGGGMYCNCELTLLDSTVADNHSNGSGKGGGGIYGSGLWHIERSTFNNNSARSSKGGAIYHDQGQLTLTNSSISNNESTFGGGLYLTSSTAVHHTTIIQNQASSAAGGQAIHAAPSNPGVTIDRSIIAEGSGDPACVHNSNLKSNNYNLFEDASCGTPQSSDLIGVDPDLGPLQDNGGPTFTHALQSNSPAIDAATCSSAVPTDQRQTPRPQGNLCDPGAYEYDGAPTNELYLPNIINKT